MKEVWTGESDCEKFVRVVSKREKRCCGGKVSTRVRIECEFYGHKNAGHCRSNFCRKFSKGELKDGED